MNRKGNLDLILLVIALLFVVLMMIFFSFIYSKVHTEFNKSPEFNTTQANKILDAGDKGYRSLDWTIFWAFIAICLFLIITSYLIRTNPIFVIIMIILLLVLLLFALIISNTYETVIIGNSEIYNLVTTYYQKTNFIFSNLPYLLFIVDIFALIALFAKPSGSNI